MSRFPAVAARAAAHKAAANRPAAKTYGYVRVSTE
jgi:hypothetical protein